MVASTSRYYEDSYHGVEFDSPAELITYCETQVDSLNWPIWIESTPPNEDDDYYPARLEVGWFMQRHGEAFVAYCLGAHTDEDVQRLRAALMRVWVARAEAGFPRRGDLYAQPG